jgi:hypothetical protein
MTLQRFRLEETQHLAWWEERSKKNRSKEGSCGWVFDSSNNFFLVVCRQTRKKRKYVIFLSFLLNHDNYFFVRQFELVVSLASSYPARSLNNNKRVGEWNCGKRSNTNRMDAIQKLQITPILVRMNCLTWEESLLAAWYEKCIRDLRWEQSQSCRTRMVWFGMDGRMQ